VFVKGVDIFMVVVKKGMLKSSIGAVNQNKKQEEGTLYCHSPLYTLGILYCHSPSD
jgi:hypothetical protein